jgi:hypothetical protein
LSRILTRLFRHLEKYDLTPILHRWGNSYFAVWKHCKEDREGTNINPLFRILSGGFKNKYNYHGTLSFTATSSAVKFESSKQTQKKFNCRGGDRFFHLTNSTEVVLDRNFTELILTTMLCLCCRFWFFEKKGLLKTWSIDKIISIRALSLGLNY